MSRKNRQSSSSPVPKNSPLELLFNEYGARYDQGRNMLELPGESIQRLVANASRRLATTGVPNQGRYFTRDVGGVAVSKGASSRSVRSFEDLRRVRSDGPLIQALHAGITWKDVAFSGLHSGRRGDIGFRVVHKDHFAPQAKQPDYIKPYIDRVTAMLRQPCPIPEYGCTSLQEWSGKSSDDLLTINRPVQEILYSAADPRVIVGFRAVDGALIYETGDFLSHWTRVNPKTHSMRPEEVLEYMSSTFDLDFTGDRSYCLVRDGIPERTYSSRDLIVRPMQTRTEIAYSHYQPGFLEMAVEAVTGFWTAWDFDMNKWSNGVWTDFFIAVTGGYRTADLQASMNQLRQRKGYRGAASLPVMQLGDATDIQRIDLKPVSDDLAFQKRFAFYGSLTAAVYREHPSIFNFPSWDGGKGATMSAPSQDTEIQQARTDGLRARMGHRAAILTSIAQRCHPDVIVVADLGDIDLEKESSTIDREVKTFMTRNEARMAKGLDPMGYWIPPEGRSSASPEELAQFYADDWNKPADQPLGGKKPGPEVGQADEHAHDDIPDQPLAKGPSAWRDDWL